MLIDGAAALSFRDACNVYDSLYPELRIATLSPEYVTADAKRDPAIEPVFFCYREGNLFWLHGVHKMPVPNSDYFDIQSPYGYGGPVSNMAEDKNPEFLSCACAWWYKWCQENNILAEFIRFHPMLEGFQYYDREMVRERSAAVIALDDIQYSVECRNKIRKAAKVGLRTIEVEPEMIASHFPMMYRGAMKAMGADEFYEFNDEYFKAFARMKNCHYLVCYAGNEPVAGALFLRGPKTLEYHLSYSTAAGRKAAAMNQVIAAACVIATGAGMDFVYLGGGTDSDPENSLFKFKASFTDQILDFDYGYHIHKPEVYAEMKKDYPDSKRVLFYR